MNEFPVPQNGNNKEVHKMKSHPQALDKSFHWPDETAVSYSVFYQSSLVLQKQLILPCSVYQPVNEGKINKSDKCV